MAITFLGNLEHKPLNAVFLLSGHDAHNSPYHYVLALTPENTLQLHHSATKQISCDLSQADILSHGKGEAPSADAMESLHNNAGIVAMTPKTFSQFIDKQFIAE